MAEALGVEEQRLKDKLYSVFRFLSYLESKDQLPSITSENPFVAEVRLEELYQMKEPLDKNYCVHKQALSAQA